MKKFKVTITAELDLPDDFELREDPTDKLLSLNRGKQYFHPTIQWMYRKHYLDPGVISKFEGPPSAGWVSADDPVADELFAPASITTSWFNAGPTQR
jgi:hypothetical protein